ncbi:mitochondrial 37S ribosomal protein uS5m [Dipodascopsis tothii]|uniref:mitochondrial 37S ribosomal protein uS5m n=1 Tax=Dipodascopsis tothii TaxID=44089 RepID=UPI0034CE8C68
MAHVGSTAARAARTAAGRREERLERLSKYYSPSLLAAITATEQAVTPELWAGRKPGKFGLTYADDLAEHDPTFDHAVHAWEDMDQPRQPLGRYVPPGAGGAAAVAGSDEELAAQTGLSAAYLGSLTEKVLVLKRVVNQTKLGKIPSQYSLMVVGDGNGMVGIGEGKDRENADVAIRKARAAAIKNLQLVPRLENRTVFGDFTHKFKTIQMEFRSRPAGFGLRVSPIIYELCVCAGIKDLSAKIHSSRNAMNVAKGALEALRAQTVPEELAAARGKKLVDVRETYFR